VRDAQIIWFRAHKGRRRLAPVAEPVRVQAHPALLAPPHHELVDPAPVQRTAVVDAQPQLGPVREPPEELLQGTELLVGVRLALDLGLWRPRESVDRIFDLFSLPAFMQVRGLTATEPVAPQPRFERGTYRLGGGRSIH
jgi:hypothetical protein